MSEMITQEELNTVITDISDLHRYHIYRDGFVFTSIDEPANVFDAIVIRYPSSADCVSPKTGFTGLSLEEHINAIKAYGIKKALIIADNIDFLPRCPHLTGLKIVPAKTAPNHFDYSPLYQMENITYLRCDTAYGARDQLSANIDYSQMRSSLKKLAVSGKGHLNYLKIQTIEELSMDNQRIENFEELDMPMLKRLRLLQCSVESLYGIENRPGLQWLDLSYMRNLSDISSLSALAPTLRSLSFENCPKITDFSVISGLKQLEYLELKGKNELPNLDFIKELPKLKFLILTMNVLDGNVECLRNIQYVDAVCKKHYNLKSKDLPKDRTDLEFKFI